MENKHPYPPAYKPGVHWAIDEAWEILDHLPVGLLPNDYRFLLAGQIAGVLMKYRGAADSAHNTTEGNLK